MRNLIIILFLGLSLNGFSQTIKVEKTTTLTIEKGNFYFEWDLDKSKIIITESNITRADCQYKFVTEYKKGYKQTYFYFGGETLVFYEFDNKDITVYYYHPTWKDLEHNIETILGNLPN